MNPYTPYNPHAPSQAQLRGHRLASYLHYCIQDLVSDAPKQLNALCVLQGLWTLQA